ncbi:MAG: hypothetical protein ACXVFK_06425 [Solirubrobacteraceae bacterium]
MAGVREMARTRFAVRVGGATLARSAARVFGPTMPSTFRWARACSRRTALAVRGPKRPSTPVAPMR